MEQQKVMPVDEICGELNDYLMNRFGCKRPPAYSVAFLETITAKRKAFDLYLRLTMEGNDRWPSGTLVISRIAFDQTRQGHGKSFLGHVAWIARSYGYLRVGIECANQNAAGFAEAFGFKRREGSKDWSVSVDDLLNSEKLIIWI